MFFWSKSIISSSEITIHLLILALKFLGLVVSSIKTSTDNTKNQIQMKNPLIASKKITKRACYSSIYAG